MIKSALCAAVLVGANCHAAPAFVAGPYQYLPLSEQAAILDAGTVTWAFATGACGQESWRGKSGQQVADANVARYVAAGKGYIVSTGGAEAKFTCASVAGMDRFVARYLSPQLVGFDFDIEDGQSARQVDDLLKQIRRIQRRHPQLRYSFTIATHAASDGSHRSLNPLGERILAAVKRHGIRDAVFNLMVMNYGPAAANACVVKEGACDMGASSLQAARNAHAKYGIAYDRIALTAMVGVNDVVSNVFTLDDARVMADGARSLGLAGVHYWSLDRDQPCVPASTKVSGTCSTIAEPAGAFGRILSVH